MSYEIGQRIITGGLGLVDDAQVGDTRPIIAWPDRWVADYEIIAVDRDRHLITGVITATAPPYELIQTRP